MEIMVRRQDVRRGWQRCLLPAALCLAIPSLLACGGCAVHYHDSKTGAEHLWGLGQLRLAVETRTDQNLAVVRSGYRVPGLCLEVGLDQFGFSLGFVDRQNLRVVRTNELAGTRMPGGIYAPLSSSKTNRWGFGHLHMRGSGSPDRHLVIVTGRALAGLSAGVGGDTSLALALSTRQQTVMQDPDFPFEMDERAPRWPGFDLFSATVDSNAGEDPEQIKTKKGTR